MKRLKIAIYTMAKNEADHVDRYAATTKDADVVVVTDTGSTDGTPELLRDRGITVHTSNIVPWRFDVATNCALCHVPADIDICVKLDLDEVIHTTDGSHWRDELERLWLPEINQVGYWYNWSWHVPGSIPAVRFRTANVHARKGFIWRHPGHAALYNTEPGKKIDAKVFEIHHYMVSKGRPNYLSLLQLAVRENRCPRTLFYLGREYSFRKMYQQCIDTLNAYLDHPDARWKAERAGAMQLIATAYEGMGDATQSLSWLMRANAECPGVRDLWWETLRHFHAQGDYLGGYWAGMKCLAINDRHNEWTTHSGRAWLDEPYALTATCAWQVGRTQEAVTILEQGLAWQPDSTACRKVAELIGMAT